MSARGLLHQAFVLHRRDYGNTSLLVEVFAPGRGRFPAVAKGARRPRHPSSALLQPFQPLWIEAIGRGEVLTLTRVEAAGTAIGLVGRALLCGFYLNELLIRLLGRCDPHDALFAFYHAALAGLGRGEPIETLLRQFEIRLLDELGYAPTLDVEVETGTPVAPDALYVLVPSRGVRRAAGSEPVEPIRGATLLALAQGDPLAASQLREARTLLRRLLEPHLGDRPLKSRELFRRFVRAGAMPIRDPAASDRAPIDTAPLSDSESFDHEP